jgi:hypothetical protein
VEVRLITAEARARPIRIGFRLVLLWLALLLLQVVVLALSPGLAQSPSWSNVGWALAIALVPAAVVTYSGRARARPREREWAMQTSSNPSSTDIDDMSRAQAEVAASKAQLAHSFRQPDKSGQELVENLGLKPAIIAGIAVAAVATVGGIVLLARRNRRAQWLRPERPSALGNAARGAGMFLIRLVARQIASQVVAKIDGAAPPAAATARQTSPY